MLVPYHRCPDSRCILRELDATPVGELRRERRGGKTDLVCDPQQPQPPYPSTHYVAYFRVHSRAVASYLARSVLYT